MCISREDLDKKKNLEKLNCVLQIASSDGTDQVDVHKDKSVAGKACTLPPAGARLAVGMALKGSRRNALLWLLVFLLSDCINGP